MGHKKDDPYLCYFSIRSMAACLVTAAAFAFSIGHTSRVLFDQFQDPAITTTPTTTLLRQISEEESLPKPVHYRDLPSFFYSSRIYEVDSGHSVGFLSRRGEWEDNPPGDDEEPSETNNSADKGTLLLERTPVKQLLVDLKNADHTRLSSEARLAQTMLEFVGETGHAILSYRCHQPEPNRVDCIGMLDPRGHVTFRAWQLYDVVTIDMLVRLSQRRLENLAGRLQELFSSSNRNAKVLKISYKRRGSSSFQERSDQQSRHTRSNHQVEPYFLKKPILERQTDFHKIQIVQAPSTWRPQEPPKSSSSNDNSSSDRLLYLDGLFQSQLHDYASHEALVHPAMLCHEEPQRVLLVSASDGTALRQVLMHNTVQHVTVLERDPQLVETCREFFPSDCSDLIGSGAESCFDDPRVQAVYADPIAWLEEIAQEQKDKYDLIIVDSL